MTDTTTTEVDIDEHANLLECKRVLGAHKKQRLHEWVEARDAALAAFEPPYVPLMTDDGIGRGVGVPAYVIKDRRLGLADGLAALHAKLVEEGHGGSATARIIEISEAERDYANRSDR